MFTITCKDRFLKFKNNFRQGISSKLKDFIYNDGAADSCGPSNCDISNILGNEKQFESAITMQKKLH